MLSLAFFVQGANVSVTLSKVHLCCDKCVKGAQTAAATVDGATVVVDKDNKTIVINAADTATAQKVANALTKAGFFGVSSDPGVKIDASTGASGAKVQTLTIQGVHLCCNNCVKAVHEAVAAVPGVTGDTATESVDSFTVSGDFNDAQVFAALQKAGLTGKVGK